MAKTSAKTIQIDEDRRHQRRGWRMERVGWSVMGLLLLAGLLGLLGDGPLSRARTGAGGLSLEYDRLQRTSAPTEYRFSADPALAPGGRLVLRLDDTLLDNAQLQSVLPEPEAVRAGPGFTEFEFALAPGAGPDARIVFQFQPTTFGRVRGNVAVPGAPPVAIDQFVFP